LLLDPDGLCGASPDVLKSLTGSDDSGSAGGFSYLKEVSEFLTAVGRSIDIFTHHELRRTICVT
jgi:hypothetical protein